MTLYEISRQATLVDKCNFALWCCFQAVLHDQKAASCPSSSQSEKHKLKSKSNFLECELVSKSKYKVLYAAIFSTRIPYFVV